MSERQGLRLLEGVRILAFTQFLLGPAACQYLADMGADVIKVEPPVGRMGARLVGRRHFHRRGQRLLHAGESQPAQRDPQPEERPRSRSRQRLIETADVVVENFRPGVMDRLGLGYEAARKINPKIIYAAGSGYGSDGPYSHLPGQDLLIQAISGLAANTGSEEQGPTVSAAAVVDQHSASLLAMGILAALVNRGRTGEGQRVEVVMVQAALDLQSSPSSTT